MNTALTSTNKYCPYCHYAIVRVKKTGFEYCSNPIMEHCDYEVSDNGDPPIIGRDARDRSVSQALKGSVIDRSTLLLNTYMEIEGRQATIDVLYLILNKVLETNTSHN